MAVSQLFKNRVDPRLNVGLREASLLVGCCEKTLLKSDAPQQRIGRRIVFNKRLLQDVTGIGPERIDVNRTGVILDQFPYVLAPGAFSPQVIVPATPI